MIEFGLIESSLTSVESGDMGNELIICIFCIERFVKFNVLKSKFLGSQYSPSRRCLDLRSSQPEDVLISAPSKTN